MSSTISKPPPPNVPGPSTGGFGNTGGVGSAISSSASEPLPPRRNAGVASKLRNTIQKIRDTPLYAFPLSTLVNQKAEPWMPDVRGPEFEPAQPAATQAPLSEKRLAGMRAKLGSATELVAGETSQPGAGAAVSTARTSDKGTADDIDALFRPPVNVPGPDDLPLGRQLLQDVQSAFPEEKAQQARDGALLLARTLRTISPKPHVAAQVWEAIKADRPPGTLAPKVERWANEALRTAASCAGAFDALWEVKRRLGHAVAAPDGPGPEPFRLALQACDKLLSLEKHHAGVLNLPQNSGQGIVEIAQLAAVRVGERAPDDGSPARPKPPMIGSSEERDTLACQALLHALAQLPVEFVDPTGKGKMKPPAAVPQQRAAYLAWRNGYDESGPGTRFNEVVHRMHKFLDWVDRAVDRPDLLSTRFPRAAANGVLAVFGKNLSPLSATKFGLAGADLGLADIGKDRFARELAHAQKIVADGLVDEVLASRAAGLATAERTDEAILQACIIEHWQMRMHGRKNVKLDPAACKSVLDAAQGMDANVQALRDSPLLKKKLNMSTLKKWGRQTLAGKQKVLDTLADHVDAARRHAKGAVVKLPDHPTSAQIRDMALDALKNTEGVSFAHQGTVGIDAAAAFGFATDLAAASAGLGPQLKFTGSKGATVRLGSSSIGSELYMGKTGKNAQQAGVAAQAGGSANAYVVKGSARVRLGPFLGSNESSSDRGVAIRVPKGAKDQKGQVAKVVAFMFDQANRRRTTGTAVSGPQLWEEFARKFIANPDLSISYQATSSNTKRIGGGTSATVSGGLLGLSAGPGGGAGVERAWSRFERTEYSGRTSFQSAGKGRRTTAHAQVGITLQDAEIQLGAGKLDQLRLPRGGLGNWRQDYTLGGEQGQVRLVIENGKVNPRASLAYNEYRREADYLARIESCREAWVGVMSNDPKTGQALDGKQAIDEYIKRVLALDVKGQSGGNRVYLDRYRLKRVAAEHIDLLLGQAGLIERKEIAGRPRELQSVRAGIDAVLKSRDSWEPDRLAVFEVESHTQERGADLILSGRSRLQASSAKRYLAELRRPGEPRTGPSAATPVTGGYPTVNLDALRGAGSTSSGSSTTNDEPLRWNPDALAAVDIPSEHDLGLNLDEIFRED